MGNGVTPDKLAEHREKYGMTYMINLFGSIIPIVLFLVLVNSKIDEYATDVEVVTSIAEHITNNHDQLERTVDSIYLLNLQDRIEKLIRAECLSPDLRAVLEPEIRSLIRQFNGISNIPYQRPTCEALQAVAGL